MKLYARDFLIWSKLTFIFILTLFVAGGCEDDDDNGPEPPEITSINPNGGLAGSIVTITGLNFGIDASAATVNFGTSVATINSITTTLVNVTVPESLSAGDVNVTITVDGRTSNEASFEVTELPVPSINSVDPSQGLPGTQITIEGTNFSEVMSENSVSIAGEDAEVTSASSTEIVAIIPDSLAAGNVQISVTVDGRTSNLANFTVLAPEISSISPSGGPIDALVEINGSNFSTNSEDNTVIFGDVIAEITSVTATQIIARVPLGVPASALQIRVIVNGSASNGLQFNVEGPEADNINPTTGAPRSQVTITGENFSATRENNEVRFGDEIATIIDASTTTLTVEVPEGVPLEEVQITITVNGQVAAGSLTFTAFIPITPLYWVQQNQSGQNELIRGIIGNSGDMETTVVHTTTNGITGIAVDSETETAYWSETELVFPSFQRVGNIYSSPGNIIYTGAPITSMDIDTQNNRIYWTENTNAFRAGLDGSNVDTLFSDQPFERLRAMTLDIDNGNLYFVDDIDDPVFNQLSTVYRGDLNGTSTSAIYDETDLPVESNVRGFIDLAVNGTSIYLAGDQTTGSVSQILKGSTDGVENLSVTYQSIPGNDDPMQGLLGLTIDREFDYLYWISFGEIDSPNLFSITGSIFRGPASPGDDNFDAESVVESLRLSNAPNSVKNGRRKSEPTKPSIGITF